MSIVVLWQGRRSKSQNPMENLVSVALYISNPLPILTIHPVLNLKQKENICLVCPNQLLKNPTNYVDKNHRDIPAKFCINLHTGTGNYFDKEHIY
jgi:hypothetical protein